MWASCGSMWIITPEAWLRGLAGSALLICFAIDPGRRGHRREWWMADYDLPRGSNCGGNLGRAKILDAPLNQQPEISDQIVRDRSVAEPWSTTDAVRNFHASLGSHFTGLKRPGSRQQRHSVRPHQATGEPDQGFAASSQITRPASRILVHAGRSSTTQLTSQQRRVIAHKQSLSSALAFVGSEFKFVAAEALSTRLRTSVAAAWQIVLEWERRRRSRQALRSLSRFEIQDFCPDLMEAEREANRPFWRA